MAGSWKFGWFRRSRDSGRQHGSDRARHGEYRQAKMEELEPRQLLSATAVSHLSPLPLASSAYTVSAFSHLVRHPVGTSVVSAAGARGVPGVQYGSRAQTGSGHGNAFVADSVSGTGVGYGVLSDARAATRGRIVTAGMAATNPQSKQRVPHQDQHVARALLPRLVQAHGKPVGSGHGSGHGKGQGKGYGHDAHGHENAERNLALGRRLHRKNTRTGSLTAAGVGSAMGSATGSASGTTSATGPSTINDAPVITSFIVASTVPDTYTLSGSVTDSDDPLTSITVAFSGVFGSYAVTATPNANGAFSVTTVCMGLQSGEADAQATDPRGAQSNIASYWVSV